MTCEPGPCEDWAAEHMKVESDGGQLRIYRSWGGADSHFDATRMTFLGYDGGMLRLEEKLSGGGVNEMRLRLAGDGSLRGVSVTIPPRNRPCEKAREWPGEHWERRSE